MSDQPSTAAYLAYRDEQGRARSFRLDPAGSPIRIGRGDAADLQLHGDPEISRIHAELERIGDAWAAVDDGLSANGTFVNDERLTGRRRLAGGDRLRTGSVLLTFHTAADPDDATHVPARSQPPVALSPTQRAVLIALCRPARRPGGWDAPATNQQIADELHLSVGAVKTHLRGLFAKFGIGELPQNQKRTRLVVLAFERGTLVDRDLEP